MNTVTPAIAHPAFEHRHSRRIETLDLTVHEFVHCNTGAVHYHLAADHDENVFMVALRTVPTDSTGVAHILEHTALCGSERFPVRDPFFWMIRRSLNTFMNAFTTSDYTAYPFASQNRKDFGNLLDVYLDAVFFARLDPLDFAQEGHRLEFESPDDPTTPLVQRGVVYNEMKGDNSSPVSQLYEALKARLYPTTTYHFNSGGDPADIPRLGYDELLAFYRSHYHPTNAVFMTFGNIPAVEHQQVFQDRALGRFDRLDETISVPPEKRYQQPQQFTLPYGVDDHEVAAKTHIVWGWLLGENTDLEMLLKCNLLSDALLDTSASPLRHALETSTLAGAISPLSGLEESSHEMSFVCGVEGSEVGHADAIESLVLAVLERVATEGIAEDRLEACLHQLELNQREIGGDGAPFGLQLMFACMSAAIHRGNPIDLLDLDAVLAKLRTLIKDPDFIKTLVKELLIDNPHRVRLVMYPDPDLNTSNEAAELARLGSLKDDMSGVDVAALIGQAKALTARQDAVEDIELLPKVGLDDIPASISVPGGESKRVGRSVLSTYAAGTNGLVYHQVVTTLPGLAQELLELLPYYTNLISEIGSGGRGYLATQQLQHSVTGGISGYASMRSEINDRHRFDGYVTLGSRTLARKCEEMMLLLKDTALAPNLSEPGRIRELVKQMRVRRDSGITGNGHSLAMTAASSCFGPVAYLNHQLSGLAALARLKQLDDTLDEASAMDALTTRLVSLHDALQSSERQLLLVCEPTLMEAAEGYLASHWGDAADSSPGTSAIKTVPGFDDAVTDQAFTTTTQVNFCAAAFPTVSESHPDSAALSVLSGVLRNSFLHRVVREQGGAYGGGASHDSTNGIFRLYSYRDPNLMRTFDAFGQGVQWIVESDIGFDLVEESILGMISSIDAPASPAGQARQTFHHGLFHRTPAHRAEVRSRILAVTVADIKRVAATYLGGIGARAVVTSDAGVKQLPGTFIVHKI